MGGEKNGLRGWGWPAPGKGPRTVWPKAVPLPFAPSGGHKRKNSPGGWSFPGVFAKQRQALPVGSVSSLTVGLMV